MSNGYSRQAAYALDEAERAARRLVFEYVGTEHLLLGLASEGSGEAATVLAALGVDPDAVRAQVNAIVNSGVGSVRSIRGRLRLTPRAQSAANFAVDEARGLGRTEVGTEHLLLGLVRESECVAALILRYMGVALPAVRAEVARVCAFPPDWRTGDAVGLARGIAADRDFGRLPILADALMDAGCNEELVLEHLRRGANHACRCGGCWVVDRLLGPEVESHRRRVRRWWRLWD